MTTTLERQFHDAMLSAYQKAKSIGYNATLFVQMVQSDGGLLTAKKLINASRPSDGYTALFERGHLELTVEAVVVDDSRWHSLFSPEELVRARKRLADYNYTPKN